MIISVGFESAREIFFGTIQITPRFSPIPITEGCVKKLVTNLYEADLIPEPGDPKGGAPYVQRIYTNKLNLSPCAEQIRAQSEPLDHEMNSYCF